MEGGFRFTGSNSSSFSTAAARQPVPAGAGTGAGAGTSGSINTRNWILGSVPSQVEVERAIRDLQRFMDALSAPKPELDGLKGLPYPHESKMSQAPGFVRLCDAFSMMQTEPALQNLVASISSDEAVWEAILSNKAVLDLRSSICSAEEKKLLGNNEEPDITNLIMRWIMGFTKSKVLELLEKLATLVNEIFQPAPKEKSTSEPNNVLDEKIRSSLLLSVVIILVIIVARNQG